MGRLSTVDLFVLTSKDPFLLVTANIICSFTKQATLMRRPIVLSLPLQLVFPGSSSIPKTKKITLTIF
jgi:hypothetical protein